MALSVTKLRKKGLMGMSLDDLVKVGESAKVSVEILDFDVNNPRFTPDKRPSSHADHAVVEKLASTADLSELVQSIATSGYINIEPLIVIERADRLAVLEGNRRLAAVKLLRDTELARKARISRPDMSAKAVASLEEILVFRVGSEDDARDLIGFKHINGPQSWDAFAKARFAARWLKDEQAKPDGMSLSEIAGRMGDQHMTIHRMVSALLVLEQAESEDIYLIEDRVKKGFSFSHLYTGLSYDEFTKYIGMRKPDRRLDPELEPVPQSHYRQLGNLLTWLYGSKSRAIEPVVKSQNPDLGKLRLVLANASAVKVLEERMNLQEAEDTATPKAMRFEQHLIAANAELQQAVQHIDGFNAAAQPELLPIAVSVFRRSFTIQSTLTAMLDRAKEESSSALDKAATE